MPAPTPLVTGSRPLITRSAFDAIKKWDPTFSAEFDEQMIENMTFSAPPPANDAKLLDTVSFIPARFLLLWANYNDPPSVPTAAYAELIAHPEYFDQVQWGDTSGFYWNGSNWVVDHSVVTFGYFPWIVSSAVWIMDPLAGAGLIENANDIPTGTVCQILNPTPGDQNYELWTVTGRWETQGNSSGVFPSPDPWSMSSDFTLQSSGTLHLGDKLVIPLPVPGIDPIGTVQSPPAPTASYAAPNYDEVWFGWGQGQYIAFV